MPAGSGFAGLDSNGGGVCSAPAIRSLHHREHITPRQVANVPHYAPARCKALFSTTNFCLRKIVQEIRRTHSQALIT